MAVVAKSVKRPELRSLKEVQRSRREFDYWPRREGKILAMPSVGVGAETHVAQRSQLFLEVGGFNQSSKDIEYG